MSHRVYLPRPAAIYPQSLGGNMFPRDLATGAVRTVEYTTVANFTVAFTPVGTHYGVEVQLRGDTAATEVTLSCQLGFDAGLDTTTGDYHWQSIGAQNGAATVGEGTTFDVALAAAANAVSGWYSSIFFFFPEHRNSTRQKHVIVSWSGELAALNQRVAIRVMKRQTAGVGTLLDAIRSLKVIPSAGNLTGTVRDYAVLR